MSKSPLTADERQRLRAEYMRGEIDWAHVRDKLCQHGIHEEEAAGIADTWQRAKHRKALGDGL